MQSPENSPTKMSLDLERDLLLSEADMRYMRKTHFEKAGCIDMEAYLDFLEEIGAFMVKKTPPMIFPCEFEL
jgi:hypothetical protein